MTTVSGGVVVTQVTPCSSCWLCRHKGSQTTRNTADVSVDTCEPQLNNELVTPEIRGRVVGKDFISSLAFSFTGWSLSFPVSEKTVCTCLQTLTRNQLAMTKYRTPALPKRELQLPDFPRIARSGLRDAPGRQCWWPSSVTSCHFLSAHRMASHATFIP